MPPYRESTLTWVLRDVSGSATTEERVKLYVLQVLGGNSKAVMLLTASAHAMQYHATQNTLEFGTALKGLILLGKEGSR